jgi:hypothetical protein
MPLNLTARSRVPIPREPASSFRLRIALNITIQSKPQSKDISRRHKTVVYWAESTDKHYASAFYSLLDPEYWQPETRETNNRKESEKMWAL